MGAGLRIVPGALWWSVFTALTALAPATIAGSLAILLAVRFLLGVGESIVYPSSNRLVAAWIPSHERGLANGLNFAGVGLGAAVTPPLIAWSLERCDGQISASIPGLWPHSQATREPDTVVSCVSNLRRSPQPLFLGWKTFRQSGPVTSCGTEIKNANRQALTLRSGRMIVFRERRHVRGRR